MDNYEINFPGQEPEAEPQPFAPAAEPQIQEPTVSITETEPVCYPAPEVSEPPRKKGRKLWKGLVACILVAALVATGCGITAFLVNSRWQAASAGTAAQISQLQNQIQQLQQQIKDNSFTGNGNSVSGSVNTSGTGLTPGQVYARCADSVVAISATIVSSSQGQTAQGTSLGSGFIISEDGYILSNYHVVEDSTSITVTTHSGESYSVKLVGYDDTNDLALLKAEATGLKPATLGSSNDLIVGDQVVAIGHPLGSETATLTVGYISAKDQSVATDGSILNMLQTDTAINSGNSGGPLFNMKGEVIGITTAKYSGTTSSGASIESIGFAIPMDDVAQKITELMENGYVSTPYMGVSVDDRNSGMGAYVVSVESGSSAEAAGLQAGDLIIGIGKHNVESVADVTQAMRSFKVGDTATVTVYRNRKILELSITFGEKPHASQNPEQTPSGGSDMPSNGDYSDWWEYFFGDKNNG